MASPPGENEADLSSPFLGPSSPPPPPPNSIAASPEFAALSSQPHFNKSFYNTCVNCLRTCNDEHFTKCLPYNLHTTSETVEEAKNDGIVALPPLSKDVNGARSKPNAHAAFESEKKAEDLRLARLFKDISPAEYDLRPWPTTETRESYSGSLFMTKPWVSTDLETWPTLEGMGLKGTKDLPFPGSQLTARGPAGEKMADGGTVVGEEEDWYEDGDEIEDDGDEHEDQVEDVVDHQKQGGAGVKEVQA